MQSKKTELKIGGQKGSKEMEKEKGRANRKWGTNKKPRCDSNLELLYTVDIITAGSCGKHLPVFDLVLELGVELFVSVAKKSKLSLLAVKDDHEVG